VTPDDPPRWWIVTGREAATDVADYLVGLRTALAAVSLPSLRAIVSTLERAYAGGGTIFVCGNGGSATTASHFAVDLAKNTRSRGAPPLRVVSLVEHVAALTAWANDEGYSFVFAGQIDGVVAPGDVVIGITTSGNSENVLNALRCARRAGAVTVGLLGAEGGNARRLADVYVLAPAGRIEQEEDIHLALAHAITTHMRGVVRAAAARTVAGPLVDVSP
jgi:D-sedoheptulose 7-phosphate isomerase